MTQTGNPTAYAASGRFMPTPTATTEPNPAYKDFQALPTTGRYHHSMAVIHISETDAARDLVSAMARAHAGEEIILDNGEFTVAIVPSPFLQNAPSPNPSRSQKLTPEN